MIMIKILEPYDMKQRWNLPGSKVVYLLMSLIVALAGTSAQADIINVAATGSGWCSSDPQYVSSDCEDSNLNLTSNTFAGNNSDGFGGGIHRDWFAFDLPTLDTISSASIFIWNDAANFNTVNPAAVFNLYEAFDLSFAGLTNGPSLGSVLVDDADAGPSRYIEIGLNANGIAALTASLGNQFIFGGNNDDGEQIFGYTSGLPIAYLTLDDGKTLPAPATLPLLGVGLAALGFSRRKSASNITFFKVQHTIKS
jgi:hypothetical protein